VPFETARNRVLATDREGRETAGATAGGDNHKEQPVNMIQRVMNGLNRAFRDEEGQGLTEYGLILVLIAVVVILMLGVLGGKVGGQYSNVANSLPH
jgi:pilus assembly protein Flp/PilA